MARFNQRSFDPNVTTNYEGEKAYKLPAEEALYSLVCTSFLADKFYASDKDERGRLNDLVTKCDPAFVARLAVYARKEMHLRSMPVMLAVELAIAQRGKDTRGDVRRAVRGVVQRADDITETLAYFASFGNDPKKLRALPWPVRKGIRDVFESGRFDAYQYAKYDRDSVVKFRDAIFLCHPKPGEQDELFKQIIARTLPTPGTWEVEQSAVGQKEYANEDEKKAAKRESWERMIHEKKLGYMATMRNLRNLLDLDIADEYRDAVCAYLTSEKAVVYSRVFPFRFWSAYREIAGIPGARPYMTALDTAARIMAKANPFLKGRVLVAGDVSGSMDQALSDKSSVTLKEVGVVMALLAMQSNPASQGVIFGTDIATINFIGDTILDKVDTILRNGLGSSTNGHLVPLAASQIYEKTGKGYDTVVIFTDCQLWDDHGFTGNSAPRGSFERAWAQYKQRVPEAKLVIVDLSGYGTTPVRIIQKDVVFVAGWSERVFEMLDAMAEGARAVELIAKYEI